MSSQLPLLANDLPLYCKYPPGRGLTPDQETRCAEDPAKAQEAKKKAEELQPPTYPFSRPGFLTVEPTSGKQIGLTLLSKDGREITFDYGKNKESLVLKPRSSAGNRQMQAQEPTPAAP
ncbi:hypothetical protein KBY71_13340 [Cyanobium sp. T1B-Tous]|uniref:hypothetical protein n=1 Tax=Cyanobium sp. T1B-Tous TaxID=2823721 RepID=UPI0020CBB909|nr:hypothetical protein [Cyanobium sp. T1B-Tous]MCP9807496.1 hypothetical protein [Cyanobium sp. T1B-Tous]